MKYETVRVTFSEVPNEISLTILITGCSLACEGCHSSHTWTDKGTELTNNHLVELILKYQSIISTVCFLGGEWEKERLVKLLKIVKSFNLKTCLYTGLNRVHPSILQQLDFIKTGRWITDLGGLNSKTTNQKFIDLKNKKDITFLFIKS